MNLEPVKQQVHELLSKDKTGHGNDHVDRVTKLALRFAEQENANKDIVTLIALLHDVDDYKIFGRENAENLTNAKNIMRAANIPSDVQTQAIDTIKCLGYSKSLAGIRPTAIEGKVVSDADMCDSLGAHGILRTHAFGAVQDRPFFDRKIFPNENLTRQQYAQKTNSVVCHIFEKILKLKDLMLTESGKTEAASRHQIVVDFLYHFFTEEDAPEWISYLENTTKKSLAN